MKRLLKYLSISGLALDNINFKSLPAVTLFLDTKEKQMVIH